MSSGESPSPKNTSSLSVHRLITLGSCSENHCVLPVIDLVGSYLCERGLLRVTSNVYLGCCRLLIERDQLEMNNAQEAATTLRMSRWSIASRLQVRSWWLFSFFYSGGAFIESVYLYTLERRVSHFTSSHPLAAVTYVHRDTALAHTI